MSRQALPESAHEDNEEYARWLFEVRRAEWESEQHEDNEESVSLLRGVDRLAKKPTVTTPAVKIFRTQRRG
jgi:hypothetical protein